MAKIHKFCLANYLLNSPIATSWLTLTGTLIPIAHVTCYDAYQRSYSVKAHSRLQLALLCPEELSNHNRNQVLLLFKVVTFLRVYLYTFLQHLVLELSAACTPSADTYTTVVSVTVNVCEDSTLQANICLSFVNLLNSTRY